MGLVNQVASADTFDATVNELATQYAKAPTQAIGLIKKVMNKSSTSTLEEMLELEATNQDIAAKTKDAGEGIMAFLQKRKANFIGK